MRTTLEQFENYKPILEKQIGESLTIDGVAGNWRIFQRRKGHRHSLDDAITGWYALQKAAQVDSFLDLGTGVGTVGLNVLWGLAPDSKMTAVEAQEISFNLLQANIKCNELSERVTTLHGDLRDLNLNKKFKLITGSPPYFPIGTGILPPDSQKAHARFELRGHVGDYTSTAKRHLSDDGIFVFCFPFQQKQRCIDLVQAEGLSIMTIRDVIPRYGKDPLFSLYSSSAWYRGPIVNEPAFTVSSDDGKYTEEMIAMQKSRGFGPDGTN